MSMHAPLSDKGDNMIETAVRFGIVLALLMLVLLLAPSASAPRSSRPPVVAAAVQSVAVKDDKLPRPVLTESYRPSFFASAPPEASLPVPTAVETPPPAGARAAVPPRRVAHDICRGRGRTYYNAGRSWRCNRRG